ncbi:MAG: hypothetical protein KAU62_06525 [Candidatus Heimdallarchaeota archaeon]|nr:hypothetical protein [Candidatus Heimdallarchaeota archaeon]MCG3255720.1 hypothetical protein [Candidatus Heimdallarchaeota archaeon]MCK4610794.1 hypothetical protein [Candidatus Heimdallarchaeota archaeon]
MTLYIIQSTGEMTECTNKEVALASSNVLVVISHNQKKIYTWIGSQSSPHSKFACARETARLRMELGYKIVNLEESSTNNDFLEAIDEAISAPSGGSATKPRPKTAPVKKETPKAKPKTAPKKAPVKKETPKAKPKKVTQPKEKKEAEPRRYEAKTVKTKIIDIEHIFKQLQVLPPMEDSIRDYILVGDSLFIAPENIDQSDSESKVQLPDGSFVADDYVPRLFLENGKIIAVELWRQT